MYKLWIINQFANTPQLPGHTRQFDIASALIHKGWSVDVFASDFNLSQRKYTRLKKFQLTSYEENNGINWHWLFATPYSVNNWKRYINMISFCIHLFLSLFFKTIPLCANSSKPDLILASSPQLPAAFFCFLIAKLINKPFILEVRDLWPQMLIDQGGKSPHSPIVRILEFIEKFLYRRSDHIVVLSKGAISYVKNKGARHISLLPNGPNLDQFIPRKLPEEGSKFDNHRPFRIVYLGAHGEANDLMNAIQAAKLLRNLPIQFVFIGDGPEKRTLKDYSRNMKNITFLDPIPKFDIPNFMSNYDAVLVSLRDTNLYRYGVSPNKLYDAYALARPVVTTITGDVNNEVELHNIGVTAPSGNPQSLAQSVEKLMSLPRFEREEMGLRARKLAEEKYSRQKIVNLYEKLMKGLIMAKRVSLD